MTVEAELAQLLIRMGTERGLDIESILAELAWAPFPSFVDANAVRGSTLEVVESWWRADLEERLGQLRRQFQPAAEVAQPLVSAPRPEPKPVAPAQPVSVAQPNSREPAEKPVLASLRQPPPPPAMPDATIQDEAALPPKDPSEALPRDATMIWNTRHG
jgi:hypothetical protein